MTEILKNIKSELPNGVVSEAIFEAANIVVYTEDKEFFKEGEGKIKEIVSKIKKRIELRAHKSILLSEEETEKTIRELVPEEAEIENIIFDIQRSIVIIESKKPGIVIGKQGSILKDIRNSTMWIPQIQRSPAIPSKITEKIRSVLYANNNYRKKFLHDLGLKIYENWNPEKMDIWVRLTYLGSGRQVGRSCLMLHTPKSKVLFDCGINPGISEGPERFPYLDVSEVGSLDTIDAIVLSHAHTDHSGMIPYLYKMGYKGPVYMTAPTRDIASLLALDFVGVAYKQAASPLYRAEDIKEMVRHSICLNFGEVFDITPDMRITFFNAGHVLGSAVTHVNIGNGLHNFVYTGDSKYAKTRLLDPAINSYPRVESLMIESTYGAKDQVHPPLSETEEKFLELVNKVIARNGKVLLPELGLGHAQETLLRVEEAIRTGKLPEIPVYLDGMLWDITAIHTAYPEFLGSNVKNKIFQDINPFLSNVFKRIGSPAERKQAIEGGPCIIIATSGMLVGGASVEYFRQLADNPNNCIIFGSYQAPGSLGRQVSEGNKIVTMDKSYGGETIEVKMQVERMYGLSPHSGRNELMNFVARMNPKPKKIIVSHGEQSRSLDLASSIYRQYRIETVVPKNLETIRLR
ncbi:MAG: beta-CASP ribonuclease aCPSF1 [Candidatus Pacearchaeota archaeon]|nr:beta-CASP ribonuclease aCPSF1 [Candidatus Pacearchaeota archaeon]